MRDSEVAAKAEWDFRTINGGDTVYGSDNREIGVVEYCEKEHC